jgi:SAM-dependent methyltransferase
MERELYSQIQAIERDHWWYVGRRRIVLDWVQRTAAPSVAPRILDIGCGTGFNMEQLRALGYERVCGLDLSTDALRFCRSRRLTALVQGDATHGPFRSASFDLVLALDLIEHVEDDVTALRELWSMLKPGGSLIVFTPAFQFLWSHQDELSHHFRRYTATSLRRRLTESGFAVRKLSYANTILFPVVLAGRMLLKLKGRGAADVRENTLHPTWSNGLLTAAFGAERPLLRLTNLPFGVSLLAVAVKA